LGNLYGRGTFNYVEIVRHALSTLEVYQGVVRLSDGVSKRNKKA
jgi:hypothetical protein